MTNTFSIGNLFSWFFGCIVMAIGLLNIFWGNDLGYGIFILLLAFIYFPPTVSFFKKISGITIPLLAKIILGAFILWSALGVAELFGKIELMARDFS